MTPEPYSEPCQTYKMELFAKIFNGFPPLTVLAKSSILDIWLGSKYAFGKYKNNWPVFFYCHIELMK